ncbi:PREDICTED: uncharacterized protein LOC106806987 [Priapulus caudatus]|uniref:Uncharacterized protein LOC106806987 n=1 Tax=Priapulus caudatus TaxID=37621 RepID=A0ABM1DXJ8_PRICU|nr:PREDICTED: uncharacterized protein LOC106806987 [Priapulus caudatus]
MKRKDMRNKMAYLPPLDMNGKAADLDSMTLKELVNFIPHMIKCSTGRNEVGWGKEVFRPPWWPRNQPWIDITKMKPRKEETWRDMFKNVIIKGYTYHNSLDVLYRRRTANRAGMQTRQQATSDRPSPREPPVLQSRLDDEPKQSRLFTHDGAATDANSVSSASLRTQASLLCVPAACVASVQDKSKGGAPVTVLVQDKSKGGAPVAVPVHENPGPPHTAKARKQFNLRPRERDAQTSQVQKLKMQPLVILSQQDLTQPVTVGKQHVTARKLHNESPTSSPPVEERTAANQTPMTSREALYVSDCRMNAVDSVSQKKEQSVISPHKSSSTRKVEDSAGAVGKKRHVSSPRVTITRHQSEPLSPLRSDAEAGMKLRPRSERLGYTVVKMSHRTVSVISPDTPERHKVSSVNRAPIVPMSPRGLRKTFSPPAIRGVDDDDDEDDSDLDDPGMSGITWGLGDSDGSSDIVEFFVCPSCQREFTSIATLEAHTPACQTEEEEMDVMEAEEEEAASDESCYLGYLGLMKKGAERSEVYRNISPSKRVVHESKPFDMSTFSRRAIGSVDVSSVLGKNMHKIVPVVSVQPKVAPYEDFCRAVTTTQTGKLRDRDYLYRCPVVYRRPKGQAPGYTHKMKFTKAQMREWKRTVRTGLNRRARVFLACCKRMQQRVVLHRLSEEVIKMWTTRRPVPVHLYRSCRVVLNNMIDVSLSGSSPGDSPHYAADYTNYPNPTMANREGYPSADISGLPEGSGVPASGAGLPLLFSCHMCGMKKIYEYNAKESITYHMSFVHNGNNDGFFVTHRESVGAAQLMVVEAFDRMSDGGGHALPYQRSSPVTQLLAPHAAASTAGGVDGASASRLPVRDWRPDRSYRSLALGGEPELPHYMSPRPSVSPRVGIAHPMQQQQQRRFPTATQAGGASSAATRKNVVVQLKPLVAARESLKVAVAADNDSDDDVQVITEVISID